jgi:hypothetical protein
VNEAHLALCSSPEWAGLVADELLPWVLDGYDLGDDLLEVGPGPGLTTDVLRRYAARLTAVELDADLAARLAARLTGTNVEVVTADATRLPFPARRFLGSGMPDDAAPHSLRGPARCGPGRAGAGSARRRRAGGVRTAWTRRSGAVCTRATSSSLSARAPWGTGFGLLDSPLPVFEVSGDRLRFAATAGG